MPILIVTTEIECEDLEEAESFARNTLVADQACGHKSTFDFSNFHKEAES